MKVIGITGGVGSGKSYISRLFALHGVPILDADKLAKKIMKSDPEIRTFLRTRIGDRALTEDDINREFIAAHIFHHPEVRAELNAIVHPRVAQATELWILENQNTAAPYLLREAAIMIESGSYRTLDALIVVSSTMALRTERLIKHRNYSPEKIQSIVEAQLSDEERNKYADYRIFNNEQQSLILQVQEIHKKITEQV